MLETMPPELVGVAVALYGSKRVHHLEAELKRHGLEEMVHIYRSHRDTTDGVRGCFKGHQAAIRSALLLKPQAKWVLVVEDDVTFERRGNRSVTTALWEACSALDTGKTNVVGLGGYCVAPMGAEVVDSVRRSRWNCAHCYVLSAAGAREVLSWEYRRASNTYGMGAHYDQVMSARLTQSILLPTIAFQRAHYGDEDITTTATGSYFYTVAQFVRNIINPRTPQIFLEYLFYMMRK